MMSDVAKMLMGAGLLLLVAGILLYVFGKIPGFGRLPGDIFVKKENFSFYFPLTTCVFLSVISSLIFLFWSRR